MRHAVAPLALVLLAALAACQSPAPSAQWGASSAPTAAPTAAAPAAVVVSPVAPQAAVPTVAPPTLAPLTFTARGGGAAAATVNGADVTLREFQRVASRARDYYVQRGVIDAASAEGQAQLNEVYGQVLDFMIDQELVRQAARQSSTSVSEDEVKQALDRVIVQQGGEEGLTRALAAQGYTRDELIAQLRDQLLTRKVVADVTKDVPTTSEQVRARHILVKTEEEARQVKARLATGEDFAKLAAEVSIDPSAKSNGGDLGWFGRGQMVASFETAAFALPVNQVSEPVQSQFGYHIIQVLEKDAAHPVPDEQLEQLRQDRFETWLEEQRKAARIERLVGLE